MATAPLSTLAPGRKSAPAWVTREVMDLLGRWGEEAVESPLRSSHRTFGIYGQMAQGMVGKGSVGTQQQ